MTKHLSTQTAPADSENSHHYQLLDRRSFLVSGAQVAAALTLWTMGSLDSLAAPKINWQKALDEVLKGAKPVPDKITLKMPEIAENGNVVSVSVDASAIETPDKRVKAIHVFATDNPWPYVASFHFTELSGKATITSRMRLARSQKVIAIAELSKTEIMITEAFVKVTIGGCGG